MSTHARDLDRYEQQADLCLRMIDGLSDEELDARPGPGAWSMRELVVHLMDSDLIGADRMKRVIATEGSTLYAYEENDFARNLDYAKRDARLAADLFHLSRRWMTAIFRSLPDAAFLKTGDHTENGPMTLAELVAGYADHVDHHLEFARGKREKLGKPM
ncbi:MAG: DinB family protein [Phycisphaerales bacterium]